MTFNEWHAKNIQPYIFAWNLKKGSHEEAFAYEGFMKKAYAAGAAGAVQLLERWNVHDPDEIEELENLTDAFLAEVR